VKNGTLPQVSYIVAPEAFSEHPNWPANYGAWYVSQVLDTLTAHPDLWSKTALLIMFDENDGLFDHLVPPFPAASADAGGSTVPVTGEIFPGSSRFVAGPYGLGPRVPMLVVSPWSRGGWVCSEVFDHTSVIQFITRRFGVTEPNISPWRQAICGDLTSAFDFRQRNESVPRLPSTAGYVPPDSDRHPSYVPVPPSAGVMPVQEKGVRPARPLPYDLRADGVISGGMLTVTFASRGAAGAVFHVTSAAAPKSFTVGAGASLAGSWPTPAAQGVRVHGPNGFYRQFTGDGPAVTAVPAGPNLQLKIANSGPAAVRVTLASAYAGTSFALTVPARGAVTYIVPAELAGGWYDMSVTVATEPGYLRRLAGHVETGRAGVSDPALGKA
jgi:phospholipase C